MTLTRTSAPVRHRIRVAGVVQGVGFRPFVYRLATELGLDGEVRNDTEGVLAEVEGPAPAVACFELRLVKDAPPLARIETVASTAVDPLGRAGFRILKSRPGGPVRTVVAPDMALCADCLRELFDPNDRRYRYPFITCTNCGPRFTITIRLPYDRPNTTMAPFALCEPCASEYRDPTDRRYHAQPVACADCGPRLWLERPSGAHSEGDAALAAAHELLGAGGIVAVKGLGGYHLACDATSNEALASLRRRKRRPDKPFAVMVRDLAGARALADLGEAEAALLTSPQRPIVLVQPRAQSPLSDLCAPDNPLLGLLIAYTPLHHLLFAPVPGTDAPVPSVLVMTSGNLSDEPICFTDEDARQRLGPLVDGFLTHDRPIHVPCDDSIVRVEHDEELPIRRSRGYAPLPIRLGFDTRPALGTGGELKNAFCLASGHDAWMSQHIGDMGSLETLHAYEASLGQLSGLYEVEPTVTIADAHPSYQVRAWAERRVGDEVALVQHHHGHVASLMAEHGLRDGERLVGCAFDGTGYGSDGTIWGGEFLVASYAGFERAAHLRAVALPGGDAAIRRPSRSALAHLWAAGIAWDRDLAPVAATSAKERAVVARQLEGNLQCVPTSSMGRLFDAVASLLGLCHEATYEAQAAMALEGAAHAGLARAGRRAPLVAFGFDGEVIDPAPVLAELVSAQRAGASTAMLSAQFHLAVAEMIAEVAEHVATRSGVDRVGLTGGVFQNTVLVGAARQALVARGLRVLTHRLVPPNDGGLALGQVAVRGRAPHEEQEAPWCS